MLRHGRARMRLKVISLPKRVRSRSDMMLALALWIQYYIIGSN